MKHHPVTPLAKSMLLALMLFVLSCMTGQAQTKVWNDVVAGYANTPVVKVTRVALYGDRTELSMHIDFVKGQWIAIAPNTVIKVDGKDYVVKGATVLTLGERFTMSEDTLDFVLTFEPVPAKTENLDLVEPGGWCVMNIRDASLLPQGITDTYWRDEATGDWLIGFAKDHVVYQNEVWDIAAVKEKKDAYTLTLLFNNMPGVKCAFHSEGHSLKAKVVKVGKMKKGLRTITIDDGKPVTCSPITTATLPDYPVKDTRRGFIDNGYNPTDSVTIIGWLKDMPAQAWQTGKEFKVSYEDIITNKEENAYTKMDSLGRFSFKMPLLNSSEVFIDWGRTTVNAFLEPGKTYFFLYDFKTGQKLWMGDDVRVQNEILTHPRSRAEADVPYDRNDVDLLVYQAQTDSTRQVQMKHLENLLQSHPTLSQRYADYQAGYYRMLQGRNIMQAQYHAKDRIVPKEVLDYVGNNFWQKAPKPYTLYRDFTTMNNDFMSELVTGRNEGLPEIMERLERDGKVTLSDEEKEQLAAYPAAAKKVQEDFLNAKDENERQAVVEAFNSSKMVTVLNGLLDRCKEPMATYGFMQVLDVVDSIGCDKTLRDIILAQRIYQQIDAMRQPVSANVLQFAENEIQLPAAFNRVKDLNDKYLAIFQRDISDSPSLKSAKDMVEMSDGEQILRKIIEPYKGKLILLDIWGTWCGPCKEALSHSAEEYERLKDIDMVFLYLANRSDDDSWKNVIKEYDVLGDNVVHYNLPADQQNAVENFLNVQFFPTYRLIDRDGQVLDVNADPRDLERQARMLEQMK
ncbi:MAG: TlpA family protein disulfide reductase [Prevotella sp.]|nr:TlpA family protein disulfide reductase [Prevotella sp.]